MKKKILAVLLSFCIITGSVIYPSRVQAENENAGADMVIAEDTAAENYIGLDAEYHTQEQIREYYKNHPVSEMDAEYVTQPSVTQPYAAGELTEETKQDALNTLNLYRYIAGVPTVSITDEAQNYAQAAALVTAVNRTLSHVPSCPEGMSDELYGAAVYGACNSNLAALDNKLYNNILGCMLESNGDPDFGHRRQILDYYNKEAGFGMAQSVSGGYYSAAYIDANLKEDKIISYPGQNQPIEYFGTGYAWTVIIPEKVDELKVNVKLTDTKTGEVWDFNRYSGNFRLDIGGNSTCAIFSPYNINYRVGDKYRVDITGIDKPISYEVNMFLLGGYVPLQSVKFQWRACYPFVGEDTYYCRLNFTPKRATNRVVTWSSSDPDIAEAVWAGTGVCRIIAKKVGTAVITATSEDGGYATSMEVEVRTRATGVTLSKTDVTIGAGQSFELSGKASPSEAMDSVEYMSDYDGDIIKTERTSYAGRIKVTGKAVGETVITAYPYSDFDVKAYCRVKVVEPVYTTELSLDVKEAELRSKESVKLNAIFSPSNVTCKEIEWKSSNINVAKVTEGEVTATGNSLGKATITAKVLDGSNQTATCTVTVYGQYPKMDAPSVVSYSSDKVILKSISGCEYSMDKNNWQDSNEFTNLESDHEYTFYIRKKASNYIKAGETSEGTTVKTRTRTNTSSECRHINTVIKNVAEATCTEKGYTGDTYCKECKEKISIGKEIAALGHDYKSKMTKMPTDSQEGIIMYTCTRCGDSYTKTVEKLSDTSDTDTEKKDTIPNEPDEEDLPEGDTSKESMTGNDFTIENGVLKSYHGKSKSVVIPKGVKEIGTKAFYQNKIVEKVTIPTSVKKIGNYAFAECKLTKAAIPKGVTSIGKYAFYGCRKLKEVTIPNSVRTVGSSAFGESGLKKVNVPEGVKKMGSMVFIACNKLESVTLPSSLKKIPDQAFAHSANLKKVIIKKGCTTIGHNAFWYCIKLKNLTLPEGVKNIKQRAFLDTAIKKITLPKSVTKIDNKYGIFGFCERNQTLREITILNPKLKLDNMLGISMPPDTAMLYGLPLQKSITIKGYKKSTSEKFVAYINKHKSKYKRPAKFIAL